MIGDDPPGLQLVKRPEVVVDPALGGEMGPLCLRRRSPWAGLAVRPVSYGRAHLKKQNPEIDQRHKRRPPSAAPFNARIESAANGPTSENVLGQERALVYPQNPVTGLPSLRSPSRRWVSN